MSEVLSEDQEIVKEISRTAMESFVDTHYIAYENSVVLNRVLNAASDDRNSEVCIEARSSSVDIGGFFMDEVNSNPRYRDSLFVGRRSGDALIGKPLRLIERKLENGSHELQLEVDVSKDESEQVVCYFRLERMLQGCFLQ